MNTQVQNIRPKILYLVTEDWFFCSHRLPLARAAKLSGYDVVVATRVACHGEQIKKEGFRLVPISLRRSGKNPWSELLSLVELISIYRAERPTTVHHVALKPILYGSIAAIVSQVPSVVNALTGLGYIFTSESRLACWLRPFILVAFRLLLNRKGSRLIVQNRDDLQLLVEARVVSEDRITLIRGSGVDTLAFTLRSEPSGDLVVILASRMLWDKGVGEFVEVAGMLRRRGVAARFVLVGDVDPDNPASIPFSQLNAWQVAGDIEWWGHRSDMAAVFEAAHVVCLPSYREGLPKVLLEAAACGCPIVATDVPGCREIVKNGYNGFLVPVKNTIKLAEALEILVKNPKIRLTMGRHGREMVEAEFSNDHVVTQTLALYRKLARL
ncbi:MAG: glycosyltransferase family 4 protein [Nitrospirota bacterium]|nr:glycosyltransferase family 4 protein [Nitrospirota bacterium]